MAPFSSRGSYGQESALVQRIVVGVAITVIGLLLGRMIPTNFFLPVVLVAGFGLAFLLLRRPVGFVLLGLFFFYGALNLVDTEIVGRVAGLFRLKDVFLAMMILHIVATHVISRRRGIVPRGALSFRLFLVFMAWIFFQMWRTKVLLHEEGMLLFRVSRHFLSYGYFLFVLYYFRQEKDWKILLVFMYAMAGVSMLLALLNALGIDTMLYPRGSLIRYSGYYMGIFKFQSPGESLVFAMFIFSFWRFCLRASRRNLALMLLLASGCMFFMYRARLAGLALGLLVSMFLAPVRARRRAVVVGVVVLVCMLTTLSVLGLIASSSAGAGRESYVEKLVSYFGRALRGLAGEETEDVVIRKLFVDSRWPLVKKYPLAGIGFVSPFGVVGWTMYRLGDLPIGHIDIGWVDALMRLGGIGALLLSLFLISAALEGKRLQAQQDLSDEERAFGLTIIVFVVVMFMSTFSFAYPTYEPPIITFSLLLAWILRVRRRKLMTPAGDQATPPQAESMPGAPAFRLPVSG